MSNKIRRCTAAAQADTPSEIVAKYPLPLAVAQFIYSDQCLAFVEEELIVGEILPRLDVKSLFRFKCVSTRYKSIISDPKFAQKYLRRAYSSPKQSFLSGLRASLLYPFTDLSPYLGLFSEKVKDFTNTSIELDQDPLSICVSTVSLPYENDHFHRILASSNGLILSIFFPDLENSEFICTLCVSNPFTKQSVKLPNPTLTKFEVMELGIATRRDHVSALLRYKVVSIHHRYVRPRDYANTIVEIFSSDTGTWAAWEVNCPGEIYKEATAETGFSYKGVLHWLDRPMGTIITYAPFDDPRQFGRIPLPNGTRAHSTSSLVYSGEDELLKYCDIDKCGLYEDRLSVWRLVSPDKGDWCLEGHFLVPSLLYSFKRLMVAPNPWNRDVICHPFVMDNKDTVKNQFTVIDPRNGEWKLVSVISDTVRAEEFCIKWASYRNGLIPIESCPWSSPFYVQP